MINSISLVDSQATSLIRQKDYEGILEQDGWETLELTLKDSHPQLLCDMIMLELKLRKLNLYEIYIYNEYIISDGVYEGAQPGTVSGWDIRWVLGTDEGIKTFPFFDRVITKNDNSQGRRIGAIIWR